MTTSLTGELQLAGECAPAEAGGPDLSALRDEWLLEYGSENTRDAYRRDINEWTRFLAASAVHPLSGVQRKHTLGWLRAMELRQTAKATRARRLAAVKSFYEWLTTMGHFTRPNPALLERKRRPRVEPSGSSTLALSREQTRQLLHAADHDTAQQAARNAAIIWLLVITGLRVSELITADVEGLGTHDGHRVLRLVVKGNVTSMVVIPDPLWVRLERYLQQRSDVRLSRLPVRVGRVGARNRRPLFVTASGARLDRGYVARLLCRLGSRIGVHAWFGPHVLRHSCATLSRDAGSALEDVQDQLGHADSRAVRRYDHGGIRLDRAPAYKLIAYLAVA